VREKIFHFKKTVKRYIICSTFINPCQGLRRNSYTLRKGLWKGLENVPIPKKVFIKVRCSQTWFMKTWHSVYDVSEPFCTLFLLYTYFLQCKAFLNYEKDFLVKKGLEISFSKILESEIIFDLEHRMFVINRGKTTWNKVTK